MAAFYDYNNQTRMRSFQQEALWSHKRDLPMVRAFFRAITNCIPEFGGSTAAREAIADSTATLDYGCNIQGGSCSGDYRGGNSMLCCSGCASAIGYLQWLPEGAAALVEKLWHPLLGFWREGKGCTLPRKWRSPTCLSYYCNTDRRGKANPVGKRLVQIGLL